MKLPSWFKESNRWKHYVGIFIISIIGTILMGIGCCGGMEFKDVHHVNGDKPIRNWDWSAWDWIDFWCGIAGGVTATIIHIFILWIIIR